MNPSRMVTHLLLAFRIRVKNVNNQGIRVKNVNNQGESVEIYKYITVPDEEDCDS
jgi:hypothetical protein